MAKKSAPKQYNVGEMMPDELNAVKALVKEFVDRLTTVDNEIELLKQDRKELLEEYAEKLDLKTLNAALKVVKIQNEVVHKDTFDLFLAALDSPEA